MFVIVNVDNKILKKFPLVNEVCRLGISTFTGVSSLRGFILSRVESTMGKYSLFGFSMFKQFRGFFILGVTKRYSATFDDCDSKVVTYRSSTLNRQQRDILGTVAFGQSQQAVFTTKVVHAYFISGNNSKCSATFNKTAVPSTSALGLRTVLGAVQVKSKQAVIYTIYIIAYFISPVVNMSNSLQTLSFGKLLLVWFLLATGITSRFGGATLTHFSFGFLYSGVL